MPGYINVDVVPLPGVQVIVNLDDPDPKVIVDLFEAQGVKRGSVTHIEGIHFFEHVANHMALMEALWLLAGLDCTLHFATPHGSSDDAFEDPTHVRPIFPGTYEYYSQPTYWRADYGFTADWQVDEVEIVVDRAIADMDPDALSNLVEHYRNMVGELNVYMHVVKPQRKPDRNLQVAPIYTVRAAGTERLDAQAD